MKLVITTQEDLEVMITEAVSKALSGYSPEVIQASHIEKPISQRDLCVFLDVTESTLIRWKTKGKIPYLQIGSRVLYQVSKVVAAIEVDNSKKNGRRY